MSTAFDEESVLVRLKRYIAESEKLMAEQHRLFREAQKFQTERILAPVIALGGLIVGGLGIAVAFFRH